MSTLLEKKLQGIDWQIGEAADFFNSAPKKAG
jgi:hypothetical protein